MFECVINVAEGRRLDVLDFLGDAAGTSLRDRHVDAAHHRSVFTLINEPAALRRDTRALIAAAMQRLDLEGHVGVHPRLGVVDVVPFVALDPREADVALGLRDETAAWIAATFEVPAFLYGLLEDGTLRTLPEVRRLAFRGLTPDYGPATPDPHRGASALGARGVLLAWNLWVTGVELARGREIAKNIRGPHVRCLAFHIAPYVQISCNLVDPLAVGPSRVYDLVRDLIGPGTIDHAELVGLAPAAVVLAESPARLEELGLSLEATIEARLALD